MRRLVLVLLAGLLFAATGGPVAAEKPARAPALTITSPRGGQTRSRVIQIAGTLRDVTAERLTLVLNGVPLSIPRSGDASRPGRCSRPGPTRSA